ncbi:hypothetical protein PC129_g23863 [Phytophthora cactorum]|uniref:Uncharacterized protein n=1 Tax=Phytophthora cactorum TaxID=29920 RepID=A0A8T1GXW7_9STRA|nr:hypothetical protein Pcac1_g25766 [Phytophthora cactorum]KAG3121881.1 hypothetical protein C6341_g27200 [Phytophthora cactorum]KAG3200346.1 hypothetical protein PC129_g23863 [Phytophthora cactorum]
MSSLTKTPAQESASVDEYHALQYKKRVEDKAAAPETILEGSSVFHTDGSMPTDYGSVISDVPMEDGEVPSSAADSESAAVTHELVTGSRRPREDDPSASSSKRSRNDEEEKAPTRYSFFSAFCPYRTRSVDAKCIRDCFQVRCDFATEPDPAVRVQRHR